MPAAVRDAARTMQRRAFELTLDWLDEVWEAEEELDPRPPDRLDEIAVPTLVISGELDIDAIRLAADHLLTAGSDARAVVWPDVAHVPSMERPDDFAAQVLGVGRALSLQAGFSGRQGPWTHVHHPYRCRLHRRHRCGGPPDHKHRLALGLLGSSHEPGTRRPSSTPPAEPLLPADSRCGRLLRGTDGDGQQADGPSNT